MAKADGHNKCRKCQGTGYLALHTEKASEWDKPDRKDELNIGDPWFLWLEKPMSSSAGKLVLDGRVSKQDCTLCEGSGVDPNYWDERVMAAACCSICHNLGVSIQLYTGGDSRTIQVCLGCLKEACKSIKKKLPEWSKENRATEAWWGEIQDMFKELSTPMEEEVGT